MRLRGQRKQRGKKKRSKEARKIRLVSLRFLASCLFASLPRASFLRSEQHVFPLKQFHGDGYGCGGVDA